MEQLPELKWIALDLLQVDGTYQRAATSKTSRHLINDIARGFDWCKFQPLTVCAAAGGMYNVVDGQHRLQGMRKHGGIPSSPCYIIPARGTSEEAESFMSLNQNRVRMHPVELYHASLAAGDETALLVQSVCEEAGVTICKSPFSSLQMPAGHLQAVDTLRRAVTVYSKNAIVRSLRTLYAAFPHAPGQMRSSTLKALLRLYAENLGAGRKVDDGRVADIIRAHTPKRMEASAGLDENFTGGTVAWVTAFLVGEYNKGMAVAQRIGVTR